MRGYGVGFTLTILAVVSILLHFFRISYPAEPVFDEVHFATYAADYASGRAHFDIHPPLGKLIYAAALVFSAEPPERSEFVTIRPVPGSRELAVLPSSIPYGEFPYVRLRAVSAAFGILLPLVLFWFLRSIGVGEIGALLAAFFMVFENGFLLQTRLILLDGMYLVLGFAALALYFGKNTSAVLGGVLWGLSLGVKLIGVVFLGPVLFSLFFLGSSLEERRRALRFTLVGLAVFFAVIPLNSLFFTNEARLNALSEGGFIAQPGTPSASRALLLENVLSALNYVTGNDTHPLSSPWYFWPAMQIPMVYYTSELGGVLQKIVLQGNPLVWFASTLAVAGAFAISRRHWKSRAPEREGEKKTFFILFAGYGLSLLPFATIVHRATFLYHYFPALIFATGLLAWFIGRWLTVSRLPRAYLICSVALIVGAVIAGFWFSFLSIYGLPLG